MKLIINNTEYPCTGKPSFGSVVRFNLPVDKPDVEELSGTIKLCSNDGFVLREIVSENYMRWYISGDTLVGTNAPNRSRWSLYQRQSLNHRRRTTWTLCS